MLASCWFFPLIPNDVAFPDINFSILTPDTKNGKGDLAGGDLNSDEINLALIAKRLWRRCDDGQFVYRSWGFDGSLLKAVYASIPFYIKNYERCTIKKS